MKEEGWIHWRKIYAIIHNKKQGVSRREISAELKGEHVIVDEKQVSNVLESLVKQKKIKKQILANDKRVAVGYAAVKQESNFFTEEEIDEQPLGHKGRIHRAKQENKSLSHPRRGGIEDGGSYKGEPISTIRSVDSQEQEVSHLSPGQLHVSDLPGRSSGTGTDGNNT